MRKGKVNSISDVMNIHRIDLEYLVDSSLMTKDALK